MHSLHVVMHVMLNKKEAYTYRIYIGIFQYKTKYLCSYKWFVI